MDEESEETHYIYEVRDENMIDPVTGNSRVRIARFLKPFVRTIREAIYIPSNSVIFSKNSTQLQWPSKINLGWSWTLPEPNWEEWVDRMAVNYGAVWDETGVYDAIFGSTFEISCNTDLILGLVEHWCPETNTFVFPWGEATVTLEDVAVLGGFPVNGAPVTTALRQDLVGVVEEMETRVLEETTHSAWMKSHMEDDLEHAAFMSLWLTRYVFAFNDGQRMRKETFPIAAFLSSGTAMALGPAVLASLYRSLTLLREQALCSSDSVFVSGLFRLVQLWAYERFPVLAPSCPNELRPSEPRVARWHKLKSKTSLPLVRSALKLGKYFRWRPYAVDLINGRCLSSYKETEQVVFSCSRLDEDLRSFVRFLSSSELVGLDGNREKYMPYRVAMQFGFDQDLPGCHSSGGFDIDMENVGFFVPSKGFEPGVSADYSKWWKESMLVSHDAIVDVLKQEKAVSRLSLLDLVHRHEIDVANRIVFLVAQTLLRDPLKSSSSEKVREPEGIVEGFEARRMGFTSHSILVEGGEDVAAPPKRMRVSYNPQMVGFDLKKDLLFKDEQRVEAGEQSQSAKTVHIFDHVDEEDALTLMAEYLGGCLPRKQEGKPLCELSGLLGVERLVCKDSEDSTELLAKIGETLTSVTNCSTTLQKMNMFVKAVDALKKSLAEKEEENKTLKSDLDRLRALCSKLRNHEIPALTRDKTALESMLSMTKGELEHFKSKLAVVEDKASEEEVIMARATALEARVAELENFMARAMAAEVKVAELKVQLKAEKELSKQFSIRDWKKSRELADLRYEFHHEVTRKCNDAVDQYKSGPQHQKDCAKQLWNSYLQGKRHVLRCAEVDGVERKLLWKWWESDHFDMNLRPGHRYIPYDAAELEDLHNEDRGQDKRAWVPPLTEDGYIPTISETANGDAQDGFNLGK